MLLIAFLPLKPGQITLAIIQYPALSILGIFIIAILVILVFIFYRRWLNYKNKIQHLEQKMQQLQEANEKLRDSEYAQRTLNATKDKFFSIIAHDLRNPFQALFGISEELYRRIDQLEKDDIKDYGKLIHESTQNLFNLLENLLQWSRTQMGNLKLSPQHLNIRETADDIITLLRTNMIEKGIQLSNEIQKDITAYSDKNVLGTILRNLLSNAVKFTDPGGTIVLKAQLEKDHTVISVSDNGKGIPREYMNQLFDLKGSQIPQGGSGEKGTGLGLILCKELVETSRGEIWVESELGKSNTFDFTIPNKNSKAN